MGKTTVRHSVTAILWLWGVLIALWLVTNCVYAQTLTTLCSFSGSNGEYPDFGLTLSGNTLYGTTECGGIAYGYGTVFSVPASGGGPAVLALFNGSSNGDNPEGGLTLSGNALYGTTQEGGTSGEGEVFSVPISGGAPTVLGSFNGFNGASPAGNLLLSGGTLYGLAFSGGTNSLGTVFSLPVSGGTPTPLATFNNDENGYYPSGNLMLIGNTLYGTTSQGGANGYGTVFSLPVSGGSLTVLASLNNFDGGNARGVTLVGNNLYAATSNGGAYGYGAVFSLPVGGGVPTVLVSFPSSTGYPTGSLTLGGNTLYGTTGQDNTNQYGTVFSLPLSGGSLTVLASFNGSNGRSPVGGLTLSGNILYGTTDQGGSNYDG